jgi:acetyl-CoA carboxylase carboxyl transferase subunit beta
MVDMVVHRHALRPTLAELCRVLTKAPVSLRDSLPTPRHNLPPSTEIALPAPPQG